MVASIYTSKLKCIYESIATILTQCLISFKKKRLKLKCHPVIVVEDTGFIM